MDTTTNTTTSRRRWTVAGALLLATAIAGAATRVGGSAAGGGALLTSARGGPITFTGKLDRNAVLLGGDGTVRMELVIGADRTAGTPSTRKPTDLVVILDRSGSMAGDKIVHARQAVRELIARLGAEDRFALVTYADEAALALPLAPAGDGARDRWLRTVDGIQADGSTNMSSGIDLALDTIESARGTGGVPRAILISDGLANRGDPTSEGLLRRAGRAARGEYMLSAVGVGADFNEYLMTALADAGTGNYYYLRGTEDLAEVFAREFDGARRTVASGLAVRIEPGDGVRVVEAAGYPLAHEDGAVVIRPGALFAGQERRLWVTLAVPPDSVGERPLGRFALAYDLGGERRSLVLDDEPRVACVRGEAEYFAGVDLSAWTRSVVEESYGKLQNDVAQAVKSGRKDEAVGLIHRYRAETSAMNDRLRSAPVAAQLQSLDAFEAEVSGAFAGPNPGERQNELSKSVSAEARNQRRTNTGN
jgi:Ca-activated chloride channel family protein